MAAERRFRVPTWAWFLLLIGFPILTYHKLVTSTRFDTTPVPPHQESVRREMPRRDNGAAMAHQMEDLIAHHDHGHQGGGHHASHDHMNRAMAALVNADSEDLDRGTDAEDVTPHEDELPAPSPADVAAYELLYPMYNSIVPEPTVPSEEGPQHKWVEVWEDAENNEECAHETQWPNHCSAEQANWDRSECQSEEPTRLLIVIPYRQREKQLKKFFEYMNEFFSDADYLDDYRFVVADQLDNDDGFNRGYISNVGFWEFAQQQQERDPEFRPNWVCVHDVDQLPEEIVSYRLRGQPVHLSSEVQQWDYQRPYPGLFGGVECMAPGHFVRLNGFSNEFFGWGGEDDDLYWRAKMNMYLCYNPNPAEYEHHSEWKFIPLRPPEGHGHFFSPRGDDHKRDGKKFNKDTRRDRQFDRTYWKKDGFTNLDYELVDTNVDINEKVWRVSVKLHETDVANAVKYPNWPEGSERWEAEAAI